MSGMSLYKMTDEYQRLLDEITDATDDGVVFQNLVEELDKLEGDIPRKIENCAKMVRCFDARAVTFKNESKFFDSKAKAANNASERLEEYIKLCMEKMNLEKVEGDTLNVKLCKNGQPSLVIDGDVPKKFLIKQEPKVDNASIKDALLAGEKLKFAQLSYGKHIRIS